MTIKGGAALFDELDASEQGEKELSPVLMPPFVDAGTFPAPLFFAVSVAESSKAAADVPAAEF